MDPARADTGRDELICVLQGHFRLQVGDERFECEPGDVLWIPNGTALKYESDGRAEVFYSPATSKNIL